MQKPNLPCLPHVMPREDAVQPHPEWFEVLSRVYLAFSFLCGLLMLSDEFIHPQKLASMNLVWPIIALYCGPRRALVLLQG